MHAVLIVQTFDVKCSDLIIFARVFEHPSFGTVSVVKSCG